MNLEQLKELCADEQELKWLVNEYSQGLKQNRDFSVLIFTHESKWLVQHFDAFGTPFSKPHVSKNIEDVQDEYC